MRRRMLLAAPLVASPLLLPAAGPVSAQPAGVVLEEFLVPSGPGIQLYLRNKRPEGATTARADRVVLCVHDGTFPASTSFDLSAGGVSWMDYMAGRGFDVWCLDLRNYGRSTREAAMGQPPGGQPLTPSRDALADIAAAAAFIREKLGVPKLVHLGWGWGAGLMGRFATENAALVDRLVLYAPEWPAEARPAQASASQANASQANGAARTAPGLPSYRSLTRAEVRARWVEGVPDNRRGALFPAGWYEHWADTTFAADPEGARQVPSVLRVPNGAAAERQSGQPPFDAARVTVPTLITLAEWDHEAPAAQALALFQALTAVPSKRMVLLGEGTHGIMLERNRGALFQAVQVFLEEGLTG
ncbi:alpha/beta hydrolase [Roseomonas marmotae]|uniref:Alpha/beta fold hydrolase n=1 Tax=Roseomonas marmotae TaxID=2768161 RepID=A0ABS3KDU3_9PROT|nr:alpha/beta fold hydrolase [Roseomonas marmotae]MBO1075643.1 alpha/beta fold hydrolase [Roseomonas marmotae]QTI79504.1 alpha/beta fold hydrolase [Roseomonas marmotae]